MTSMRQTTVVTSSSASSHHLLDGASPLDGSLDLLLEDLQNSVSRPSSAVGSAANFNGPTSTTSRVVQREVRVQRSAGATPPSVQYLQPANTTTVVTERASSPLLMTTTHQHGSLPEHQQTMTTYKTYKYEYRGADGSISHPPVTGLVVDGTPRASSVSPTPPHATTYTETAPPDNRLRQNLNELDSLLVDLHHAQQSTPNIDPNSQQAQQITRTVRTYQFDNTYGTPNSVRRELYPSSPKPERSTRAKSPPSTHNYSPSPIRSQSPIRASSPNRKVTTTVKTYTYEIPADNPNVPQVVNSPTVKTYSYELPPNKASPPPEDTVITYKYSTSNIPNNKKIPNEPNEAPIVKTYKYPSQPMEREPLIESPSPKQQQPPGNNTYITYNYSSSTNQTGHPPPSPHNPQRESPYPNQREPPHRPFPSPSPVPLASAEPPKRLDELMASFTDTETLDNNFDRHPERPVPPAPLDDYPDTVSPPVAPVRPAAPVQERIRTKNVAGPPVYYPPGVDMFARKDEPVHAKMKEGAASGDSGKGSGVGVAAVPVCLPVCCAMPCVIM